MTYRLPILLFSLILLSFSLNAQDIYKVTADKLNVRETKDPTSKKIGFVPQDENVQVLDSTDAKFFKIKVTNGEGYVSSDYLKRISPVKAAEAKSPKITVAPTAPKDNSKMIFISFVAVIMVALLFCIFKFINNKFIMALAACVVLAVGYLSYLTFLSEKSVSGKYISTGDAEYQSLDFKSKNSVIIQDNYTDSLISTQYDIEGDMIKFKLQENTVLLLIRDNNTLVGEGFTRGTFTKQ
ncbi:MAG: SH3 domain-containing protein [Pedobacter sp.]|nr:MAG: SH3 domain-containing protein [Pedobacter sp.]